MNTGTVKIASSVELRQAVPGAPDLWVSFATKFIGSDSDPFVVKVCLDDERGHTLDLFEIERDVLTAGMSERVVAGLFQAWPVELDGEPFMVLARPTASEEMTEYQIPVAHLKRFLDKSSWIVAQGERQINLDAEAQESCRQYLDELLDHAFEEEED